MVPLAMSTVPEMLLFPSSDVVIRGLLIANPAICSDEEYEASLDFKSQGQRWDFRNSCDVPTQRDDRRSARTALVYCSESRHPLLANGAVVVVDLDLIP